MSWYASDPSGNFAMKRIVTLIPAYKQEYLSELLIGLNNQSYKNFYVILSDDSPQGQVTKLLQSEQFKPLLERLEFRVIQGPRRSGHVNMLHLLEAWDGKAELVHFLFDDDFIYPRFYEYHASVHQAAGGAACSISRRWNAAVSGLPISSLPMPVDIDYGIARIAPLSSDVLFKTTVPHCNNWLGEFSNTVLSASEARVVADPQLSGIPYLGLQDIGIFLKLSINDKVFLIQDNLGFFRFNPQQNTGKPHTPVIKAAYLAWCALAAAAWRMRKISPVETFGAFKRIEWKLRELYPHDEQMQRFVSLSSGYREFSPELVEEFIAMWRELLDSQGRLWK